jgi:hypothetical protein
MNDQVDAIRDRAIRNAEGLLRVLLEVETQLTAAHRNWAGLSPPELLQLRRSVTWFARQLQKDLKKLEAQR